MPHVMVPEVFRGRLGALTLGLLLLEIVTAMQIFTVATVLPIVAHALRGVASYGAALAIGPVAVFLTLPLCPPAIARFGLPRVLTLGTVVYVAGIACAAIAPSMPAFIAGRGLQGLGAGFLVSLSLGAVASSFPPERRAKVISLLAAGWIVPGVVGPPYAALAAELFGWRIALVLLMPVLLVARFIVARFVVAPPQAKAAPVPLRWTAAFVAAIAVMLGGDGWAPPLGAVALVAGAAAAMLAASRFAPSGTLRAARGRPAAIAALFALSFAYFGADGIVTLVAVDGMHRSLYTGGAILTLSTVAWSLTSLAQPVLVPRLRLTGARAAVTGVLSIAGGFALAAVALARDPHGAFALGAFGAAWIVAGSGIGLAYPALSTAAIDVAPGIAMTAASAAVLAELLGVTMSQAVAGSFVGGRAIAGPLDARLSIAYAFFAVSALGAAFVASRTHAARPA